MENINFKFEKLTIWQKAMDFGDEQFSTLYSDAFNLMNLMIAFRKNIK